MHLIRTKDKWLIDLMLLKRDSFRLHVFALVIYKGTRCLLRTPDIHIPMPIKVFKVRSPGATTPAHYKGSTAIDGTTGEHKVDR